MCLWVCGLVYGFCLWVCGDGYWVCGFVANCMQSVISEFALERNIPDDVLQRKIFNKADLTIFDIKDCFYRLVGRSVYGLCQ
ncbi:hypothetical protein RCL_jg2523.t1 [Rhizophagus clarus]|uniref:Uncharacterized protein n=1 Tax=Rhizophagus clarus TaxID=94130 RepID=A0A8H3LMC2_9GLOM|nr:hypothetical protein RCL_jg2523.t1 [Rhizophagus clarus]